MAATVVSTVLNRENYKDWSFRMKTYFLAEDLWDVVEDIVMEPLEGEELKAWKKKDAKTLYAIQNSCGDETYPLINYATTAKKAWQDLSRILSRYESSPDDEKDESERPVSEAYPNTPEAALEEGPSVTRGAGHDGIQETFVKYVESDKWDDAINFLRQHPGAASASMTDFPHGTALHYAIRKRCSVLIIQQLVELMYGKHLEETDLNDSTALDDLIRLFPERVDVAECMVKKNPNLLTILPRRKQKPLVLSAQRNPKGERMACYLYSLTPPETIKVIDAAQLISDGFRLQRFDIAWNLIKRYPKLAMAIDHDGNIPLATLASYRFAFKSGRPLSLWENLIYYGISIKPLPSINKDSHINVDLGPLAEQKENRRHHLISSGMDLFRRLVVNLQTLLGINRMYQIKLVHERVKQFLPLMCQAVRKKDISDYQGTKLEEALCVAAERGHVKYITDLLGYSELELEYENLPRLFQIVVECRQYNVYNLICELLQKEDVYNRIGGLRGIVENTDDFGNNMLHAVARITPLSQIDHIQGAALQMQRELQWFKEVESIAEPKDCESVNKDNKTPQNVFKDNHKELRKEAEKSTKETATSCTVVGALIVTIMFAAAFTVPGENDKNDEKPDLPLFLTNKVFTTFIVSDAISLFSSTTSVIMFLGILTSRYSEDDFYKFLPTKMIIGLFTLFLSIVTMMIVFSCGLYIMLDGKSSIVIPSILLASFPVISFIWMQFPLIVKLFISTFGQGVFDRKQKNLF